MKRLLFILLLAITTTVGYSQTQNIRERLAVLDNKVVVDRILELDSLGLYHFYNKEYNEALDASLKELDLLQKAFGADDTICVNELAFISRCYFRQGANKKALEYGLKSAELYGEKCSKENVKYANLIDNVALYYTNVEDYKNAEKYSDEAVRIHSKYFVNDKEMGGVLAHAAEIKSILGKIDEAVPLQEHALSVIENAEGNHSEHYINELKYMKRYYTEAGNKEKAEETNALLEQLQEERKRGYVPPLVDFNTPEKCREHNEDAYYCSLYFLNHYLDAPKMSQAARYIFNWAANAPDVDVFLGEPETKWLNNDKNYAFVIAYMAACNKYALTHNPVDPEEQYVTAYTDLLNYYEVNKEKGLTEEIEAFEEYIKLYKKKPEKMFDKIRSGFKPAKKAIESGEYDELKKAKAEEDAKAAAKAQ